MILASSLISKTRRGALLSRIMVGCVEPRWGRDGVFKAVTREATEFVQKEGNLYMSLCIKCGHPSLYTVRSKSSAFSLPGSNKGHGWVYSTRGSRRASVGYQRHSLEC